MKNREDILHSVDGVSIKDVIDKSRSWIQAHTPPEKKAKIKIEK
jgi:hypothetical protein